MKAQPGSKEIAGPFQVVGVLANGTRDVLVEAKDMKSAQDWYDCYEDDPKWKELLIEPVAEPSKPSNKGGDVSAPNRLEKAKIIREVVSELGEGAKFNQVQEECEKRGIAVAPSQFYLARKTVFGTKRARASSNGRMHKVVRNSASPTFRKLHGQVQASGIDEVVAFAKAVKGVGGIERAKELLGTLADLFA